MSFKCAFLCPFEMENICMKIYARRWNSACGEKGSVWLMYIKDKMDSDALSGGTQLTPVWNPDSPW